MQFQAIIFVPTFEGALGFVSIFPQHQTCTPHPPLSNMPYLTPFVQEAMKLFWFKDDMFQSPLPHLLIGIVHDAAFPYSGICSIRPTHVPFSLNRPTTHELCACISCPNLAKIGNFLDCLFLSLHWVTQSWALSFHLMLPKTTQSTYFIHPKCSLAFHTSFLHKLANFPSNSFVPKQSITPHHKHDI